MNPHDLGDPEPSGGRRGIPVPHGEVIPDAKDGEGKGAGRGHKLDVPGQRRVAAVVEGPFLRLHPEPAGLPAAGTVGHAAGMEGGREGDPAERERDGSPGIHRDPLLDPFFGEPLGHLVAADQGCAGSGRDRLRVRDMIEMAVGEQDEVGPERGDIDDPGGQRVGRDKGVEQQAEPTGLDGEAGVAVAGELHGCSIFPGAVRGAKPELRTGGNFNRPLALLPEQPHSGTGPAGMNLDPSKKIAGLLVPLFALRGRHDLGIGDTSALAELVEWAARNRFRAVQILPVNETGGDHSPYNVLSAFAIDPSTITTHPSWLPDLTPGDYRTVTARHDTESLRSGPVDYPRVKALKAELLRASWERFRRGDGRGGRARLFHSFLETHVSWLADYTLHRALLERNDGEENPASWSGGCRDAASARGWLGSLGAGERADFEERRIFFAYVQWIAFSQWSAVADTAETLGVALIGDVPVGVSPGGADLFARPDLFDRERSCGAPPEKVFKSDPFTERWGQNWGFPLYRWEEMARDGFAWWRMRLRVLRSLFHMVRVDHALGFFRIYSFPWDPRRNGQFTDLSDDEARALTGGPLPGFVERDDSTPENRSLNERHGEVLLGMLASETGEHRLVAEDLGEVAPYVRPVLERLGLPGFKIPMWERDEEGRMLPGSAYPRVSLATYATHDHAPLSVQWREWQEGLSRGGEEAEGCRRILGELLSYAGLDGTPVETPFEGAVHRSLLKGLLRSNSWLAVVMVTDLFGSDQRFNVPGAVGSANWTARIPAPVATWDSLHAGLLSRWKEETEASGR